MQSANRKDRRIAKQIEPPEDPPEEQPTPRGFEAPPCCACRALAKGKNYSHVYATKREDGKAVRYCRCGFCGNTFKVTGD